jgi:hypothetical protein
VSRATTDARAPVPAAGRTGPSSFGAALVLLFLALALASCQNTDLSSGPFLVHDEPPVEPVDPCPAPSDVPVVINEAMLVNTGSVPGPGGVPLPWIELYNPSVADFDLGGATITDDLSDPEKWEIPCDAGFLGSGEFLVLFFSDEMLSSDDLIIDFLPGTTGEVKLYLNGANTLDIAAIDADALGFDLTAGRTPDGEGELVLLLAPTPGTPNSPPLVAPPATFIRGDVDADGDVDPDDLALLNLIVFAGIGEVPACEDRLDVNDDGAIDIGDPNFLAIALAPGGPAIPPPFPAEGVDSTADEIPCESETP